MTAQNYYLEEINFTSEIEDSFFPEHEEKILQTLTKEQSVGMIGGFCQRDYPVYFISNYMLESVGYSYQEFMEKTNGNYIELVYEKDRDVFQQNLYQEVKGLEYRLVNKEGTTIWVSETRGNSKSAKGENLWISAIRIIDQRQSRETKLVNALGQEYHRIIYIDQKTQKYEFVWTQDERDNLKKDGTFPEFLNIARKYLKEYVHPEDTEVENIYHMLEKFLQKKQTEEQQMELSFREKLQESYQWMQLKVVMGGECNCGNGYMALVFRNVNQTVCQELERNQLLKSALDRVETAAGVKRDFLSKMSHDLRTPLNAILGITKLARQQKNDSHSVAEYMEVIDSSAKHLLHLVDELLEMNEFETGTYVSKTVDFEMKDFVQEAVEMVLPKLQEKNQRIKVFTEGITKEKITGDFKALEKVCVNLLSNASKYSGENQEIELSVHEMPRMKENDRTYQFRVRDHGMGIPSNKMEQIFEPFERIEDTRISKIPDVGLGLAITKNIVKMLQGDIQAFSEEGSGSEFVVTIPFIPYETEEEEEKGEYFVEGMRVLLVEDNDINRDLSYRVLSDEGVQVETAENGQEAVELFGKKESGYYDAILMDIQMPIMDGYQATRKIRTMVEKEGDDVPIIAVTADAFQEDVQLAMEAGMNAHVKKPVDYDILLGILSNVREQQERI